MQSIEQAEQIGKQFVEHFYQVFKTDKASLGRLYHAESILNWEGRRFVGQQAISAQHSGLPFGSIDFKFRTVDCQPTAGGGVLVFVTGQLITEGESKALDFSQIFHLLNANNAWMISNDMFRLSYG
jgi:Nuclear transport factor 2 (NTF2) domain